MPSSASTAPSSVTTQSGRGQGPCWAPSQVDQRSPSGGPSGWVSTSKPLRLQRSGESSFGSSNRWWDNAVLQRGKGSSADRTHDSCRHLGPSLGCVVAWGQVARWPPCSGPDGHGLQCCHPARPARRRQRNYQRPGAGGRRPVVGLTALSPVLARRRSAYSRVASARIPPSTKAASPMAPLQETEGLTEDQRELLAVVREFVDEQIIPVAHELEHADEYPTKIVEGMKEMGIFGLMIPEEYGGAGGVAAHLRAHRRGDRPRLDERQRHHQHPLHRGVDAAAARHRGAEAALPAADGDRRGARRVLDERARVRLRRRRASGPRRCGPPTGSDEWSITGQKMWLTNGGSANLVAVLTKTDDEAARAARSTSG